MSIVGNPGVLKEINSSMIERLLYEHGPVSKPAIANIVNLSLPTVNKIIDDLESRGIVSPVGLTEKGPGRKAMLYQINKDFGCIVALYYSWGAYVCRLTDMAGNTVFEAVSEFDGSTTGTALDSTKKAIEKMLARAKTEVKEIGIGVPGAVLPGEKLFAIPRITVWEGFDLENALSDCYDAHIFIENNVKLSAVGYYHKYLIDELENIVYIYAGDGINSGIIINKKLYRGSTNFSGELGYMASFNEGSPQYDFTHEGGYLEKKLNSLAGSGSGCFSGNKEALINICTVIAANCIALINPAAIVFGGEAVDAPFIEDIKNSLLSYSPKRSMPQIIYDDSEKIGLDGLVYACLGEIITEVQIVQKSGV